MDVTQLENAIYDLHHLLKVDKVEEKEFQSYFERYDVVFNILGYQKAYPHLEIELTNELKEEFGQESFIPDFLTEKFNGNFDIFELKTPQEKLIKNRRKSRKSFYAKIEEYLAQTMEYSECFDEQEVREKFKEKYSIDIHKQLDVVMIIGRDVDLDRKQLHRLTRRYSQHIDIITFDEILKRLQFYYASGFRDISSYSSSSSIYLVMKLDNTSSQDLRKYVVDIGDAIDRRRLSIFLTKTNMICFEIIDDDGESFSVKADFLSKIDKKNPFHLVCQFATNTDHTILQILVNNQTVGEYKVDGLLKIPPDIFDNDNGGQSNFKFAYLGSDIQGRNCNLGFEHHGFIILEPLNFLELRGALFGGIEQLKEKTGHANLLICPGSYCRLW